MVNCFHHVQILWVYSKTKLRTILWNDSNLLKSFRKSLELFWFSRWVGQLFKLTILIIFNPLSGSSKTKLTLSDISDDVSDDDRGIFSCKSATVLLSPFISPLTESKKKILIRRISLLTNVPKNKSQLWTWSKGAYYECLKPTSQRNGLISLLTMTESKKKSHEKN